MTNKLKDMKVKTDPTHYEMVGALLKKDEEGIVAKEVITRDKGMIRVALRHGCPVFWISRWHAQFMADCDLGRTWERLANAPTLWNSESLFT